MAATAKRNSGNRELGTSELGVDERYNKSQSAADVRGLSFSDDREKEKVSVLFEVDNLSSWIDSLDNSVESLFKRLQPILPDADFEDASQKSQDMSEYSLVIRRLKVFSNRINVLRDRIDALEYSVQI